MSKGMLQIEEHIDRHGEGDPKLILDLNAAIAAHLYHAKWVINGTSQADVVVKWYLSTFV